MFVKSSLFTKGFVLAACLLAVVAAQTCVCPLITQKQVFENADVVAKVKVENRTVTNDWIIYDVTYETIFKPKNLNTDRRQIISNPAVTKCGVPNLIAKQEYLIAAKANGERLEITNCGQFPPRLVARPISGPPLWSTVNPQLVKKLESGKFVL
ncbi:hypothetical protein M3Y97_01125900 [Aphelenchoides bicaudatus]|nr:hypothetical protein M3Y97_01125900 [Aphelenchoides bicaudatus]